MGEMRRDYGMRRNSVKNARMFVSGRRWLSINTGK